VIGVETGVGKQIQTVHTIPAHIENQWPLNLGCIEKGEDQEFFGSSVSQMAVSFGTLQYCSGIFRPIAPSYI
jgi:hypothetical protein